MNSSGFRTLVVLLLAPKLIVPPSNRNKCVEYPRAKLIFSSILFRISLWTRARAYKQTDWSNQFTTMEEGTHNPEIFNEFFIFICILAFNFELLTRFYFIFYKNFSHISVSMEFTSFLVLLWFDIRCGHEFSNCIVIFSFFRCRSYQRKAIFILYLCFSHSHWLTPKRITTTIAEQQ